MDINLDDLFDDKFKSPFVEGAIVNAIQLTGGADFDTTSRDAALKRIADMDKAMREDSSEMLPVKEARKLMFGTETIEEEQLTIEQVFADMELMNEEYPEDIEASIGMLEGTFEAAQDVLFSNPVYNTPVEIKEDTVLVHEGELVEKDTPLSKAMNELKETQEEYEESGTTLEELRSAIAQQQRDLDRLKKNYTQGMDKRADNRLKIKTLETTVSNEAHREAERLKDIEIKSKRKGAMLAFHRDIEELNPEWKNYAYDHQWEGASTLALHGSGLLADDMGLGKTLSAIMWLDMIKAKKVLVVTPNDTNSNFTMELGMWAKHRFVYTLAGASKEGRQVMMDAILLPRVAAGGDLTLSVNFEQLYSDKDYFNTLMGVKWDAIIIDEAHNFKNEKSILLQRLVALRDSNVVDGVPVTKILPMTGTFILNKPEDIWPALNLIDSQAFPDLKQFRDYYCKYDYELQRYGFREGGERSMLIHLGGRIVKRTMAEAGIVLPKQTIHEVDLSFNDNYHGQQKVMQQLAEHSQIILDSTRKTTVIEQIALITRQRQCAVWPAGITIKYPDDYEDRELAGTVAFSVGDTMQESIKVDWTIAKIKELRTPTAEFPKGQRIAVFSQFKTALAAMEEMLTKQGIKVVRYDGDTKQDTKMLVKRDFDRKHVDITGEYEFEVVLCNYKTGGVGLNFTHATQLISIDEEWNPGKNNQAFARTNRIGQTQENHVWIPRLTNSIDSWMHSLNKQKAQLIAGFDTEIDLQKEFSDFLATVKGNE